MLFPFFNRINHVVLDACFVYTPIKFFITRTGIHSQQPKHIKPESKDKHLSIRRDVYHYTGVVFYNFRPIVVYCRRPIRIKLSSNFCFGRPLHSIRREYHGHLRPLRRDDNTLSITLIPVRRTVCNTLRVRETMPRPTVLRFKIIFPFYPL